MIETEINNINSPYLETILCDVYKAAVALDNEKQRRAVEICNGMVLYMKRKCSSDFILQSLVNGITYRGSYYTGLKVKDPDEFDIDFQIKLPRVIMKHIVFDRTEAGFISINILEGYKKICENPNSRIKYEFLEKFMDYEGYLLGSKFRRQLESFISKLFKPQMVLSLNGLPVIVNHIKKSGPAFTIQLVYEDLKLDIDFVFVLYFDEHNAPRIRIKNFSIFDSEYFWFAVPKPSPTNERSWRISFPIHENHYLDSSYYLKPTLKLLKCLRDAQRWNIASYYIVTLFLHEAVLVKNSEYNRKFWQQPISKLFLIMLNKFSHAMIEHKIPFLWDEECNLISHMNQNTCENIHGRITGMLKQIQKYAYDKEEISKYVIQDMFRIYPPPEEESNSCVIL